jgi:nucleoid-associated protein YgaU
MGLFSFLKGIGKKVGLGREAEDIKKDIAEALGGSVENLVVAFDDGTVTLRGTVDSQATREKAVLLAGNVESVEHVNDQLTVRTPEPAAPEPVFYTVQKGDSLWKIASAHYGNGNKWQALFEANREVIKDPDLIYPGQQIRVPEL